MDRHRIGTFGPGGQFTVVLDLNDGTTLSYVRNTFKVTPSEKSPLYAASNRRYGGARKSGETHDNGMIEGQWLVGSGATADATLATLDGLLAMLESDRSDLHYEWRPEGASRSTYFELRGGLQWEPEYLWQMFAGARVMQVKGGWQVAPLALGDPMDIMDDFAVDTFADYTFDAGGGTLGLTGGQWYATSAAEKRLHHSARGYSYSDVQVTLKFKTGGFDGGYAAVIARRLSSTVYLFAQANVGENSLLLGYVDGAEYSLALNATPVLATDTTYWLRLICEGNLITAQIFTVEPTPLAAPAWDVAWTVSGALADLLGAGVAGGVGLRLIPNDTGVGATAWRYDDFEALPFTYRRAGAQTVAAHVFELSGVPGTAPALVDAHTTMPSGVLARSALIGWTTTPTGAAPPFGLIEAENGAATTDATCSGGEYLPATAGIVDATFVVDPGTLPVDDFTEAISVEILIIFRANAAGDADLTTRAFAQDTGDSSFIYTAEYGNQAKTVTTASGRVITRAGTLTFPRESGLWTVAATLDGAAILGCDAAIMVPVRQRACTATNQLTSDAQEFVQNTLSVEATKIIRSDLSGRMSPAGGTPQPHLGLSGQLLEFPPGDVSVLHRLGLGVIDAPDAAALEDLDTSEMATHYAITPRFHLARSG